MKTKSFALDIKAVEDDGRFSGYGSTFGGSPDAGGDIVMPGAFAESLAAHRRNGTKPKMLWQHDTRQPIGVWIDLAEDGKGLRVDGRLNLAKQIGRDVHSDLKMGAVDGLSIGYEIMTGGAEADPKRPGVRLLRKLDLWEISVVTFPMNENAFVTEVKTASQVMREHIAREGEMPDLPVLESVLREAGLSKSQAKVVAAHGLPELLRREAGGDAAAHVQPEIMKALQDLRRTVSQPLTQHGD